ncbi:MAG: DEAD/DEAH box helicase [Deltaproteobacteria bacterium]|jgi:hypothetical protein|nr:DEAD/DEAH box helicase [Deltaproteobacteria bacterium]
MLKNTERLLPENEDFDNSTPLDIIHYLVVVKGQDEVSYEEILALLNYVSPPTKEQICLDPEIALTAHENFTTMSRTLGGDIEAKIEEFEKLAHLSSNEVFKAKWLTQANLLSNLRPPLDATNVTYSLLHDWIPHDYKIAFAMETLGVPIKFQHNAWRFDFANKTKKFKYMPADLVYFLKYLNKEPLYCNKDEKWIFFAKHNNFDSSFNEWMRSNFANIDLIELFNKRFNSYLPVKYEDSPIGLERALSGQIILHPHQNREIRRLFHEGLGLCAFDVGLGKTFVALALATWARQEGRFNRTLIVVPNSTIGHWTEESRRFFSEAYFRRNAVVIGQGEKLSLPIPDETSLLIMTKEMFCSLPIKDETKEAFVQYTDAFNNSTNLKDDRHWTLMDENKPFFEDLGVDSLIIDEAHMFKNGYPSSGRFKNIAYLSHPIMSKSALNALAKAYWIRQKNQGLGVYGLTATPLTNSPFEIYNMLSLVCDHKELVKMGFNQVDDIIRLFGKIKIINKVKVNGQVEPTEALMGFVNLDGLRNTFRKYVNLVGLKDIKNELSSPEQLDKVESVILSEAQQTQYHNIRQLADQLSKSKTPNMTHIFSLIRDMDRLTLDIDLYYRKSSYIFKTADRKKVDALVDSLPSTCEHYVLEPNTLSWSVVTSSTEIELVEKDDSIILRVPDSLDKIVAHALKNNYIDESSLTHPLNPKYKKLVGVLRQYLDRGGNQLIFTEEKSQHDKLRRILAHELEIPLSAIGLINAERAMGRQLDRIIDGYNQGKIKIIIGNRKAELGLNLQSNTMAIHHLTFPWTPASLHQRNGRGVRQGNQFETVLVHYYYAENTFDQFRHAVLAVKANWLGELIEGQQSVMNNGQAIDIEEMLDLLAETPEVAEERRIKRLALAENALLLRREQEFYNALYNLNQLEAEIAKNKDNKLKKTNQLKSKIYKYSDLIEQTKNNISLVNSASNEFISLTSKIFTYIDKNKELKAQLTTITTESDTLINSLINIKEKSIKYILNLSKTCTAPFDLSLLDRLSDFVLIKPNKIIFQNDFYMTKIKVNNFFLGYKVLGFNMNDKCFSVDIYVPMEKVQKGSISFDEMADLHKTTLDDFICANTWKYGLMPKSGFITQEIFERMGAWLPLDLEAGVVYRQGDSIIVAWDPSWPVTDQALPLWPEPDKPEFREAIFKRYLEDKKIKAINPDLARDLFGPDYEIQALNYIEEGPEKDLLKLVEQVWRKTGDLDLFNQLSPTEALKKLTDIFEAQSRADAALKPNNDPKATDKKLH